MKRFVLTALILAGATGYGVAPATASQPCSTSTTTVHATRWERVPLRRHGHVVYLHHHRVFVRKLVHYVKHVQHFDCTGTTPAGATPASATATRLKAHIDPSFVQNPANPLDVTYSYSASATAEPTTTTMATTASVTPVSLPEGVLDLYSDGSLACSINVGGPNTGGQCPVGYHTTGAHTVVVTYISGPTTATETSTEQIEPFTTTVTTSAAGTHEAGYNGGSLRWTLTPTVTTQTGETLHPHEAEYCMVNSATGELTSEPAYACTTSVEGLTETFARYSAEAHSPIVATAPGGMGAGIFATACEVQGVCVARNGIAQEALEDGALSIRVRYAGAEGYQASSVTVPVNVELAAAGL